jgi:hypothetical protein
MARTDSEKRDIYKKWHELINMSETALKSWAEDDDRLLASINRQEAKSEGGIQSGYDSFHRIKRRKKKPFKEWSDSDFDNANQEIGFNSRMLGGTPGKPVSNSGRSKWEISLRNWGHDPSLKSSPAHNKWKSWKKKQEETNMKKSHQVRVLKRAIIATRNRPDLAPQREEYIRLLKAHNSRVASGDPNKELEKPAKKLGLSRKDMYEAWLPLLKKVSGLIKPEYQVQISKFISSYGLLGFFNGLYKDTMKGTIKPSNPVEKFLASIFKGLSISKTAEMTIRVLQAESLDDIAEVGRAQGRDMLGEWGLGDAKLKKRMYENKVGRNVTWEEFAEQVEDKRLYTMLVKYLTYIEDSKIFGVKLLFTIVKGAGVAWLLGGTLAGITFGVVAFLKFIFALAVCFGWRNAAQFLRKTGIMLTALAPSVLIDLGRVLGLPFDIFHGIVNKVSQATDAVVNFFSKKAVQEIRMLLREDMDFRREFLITQKRRHI